MNFWLDKTVQSLHHQLMTLHDYLKLHDLTDSEFANLVNRDRTTVLRWRKGETRPDWMGLEAVSAATNGVVRPDDFLRVQPVANEATV